MTRKAKELERPNALWYQEKVLQVLKGAWSDISYQHNKKQFRDWWYGSYTNGFQYFTTVRETWLQHWSFDISDKRNMYLEQTKQSLILCQSLTFRIKGICTSNKLNRVWFFVKALHLFKLLLIIKNTCIHIDCRVNFLTRLLSDDYTNFKPATYRQI